MKNVGDGDVGGVAGAAVGRERREHAAAGGELHHRLRQVPVEPLPAKFGPGDTLNTCLVFLSPGPGHAAIGELPAEPGVQPDHLDR